MSVAAAVNQTIERQTPGRIFGYEVFNDYTRAPDAVVQAVRRNLQNGRVKRVSKGRFYTPKTGLLGPMAVSDGELLRDALYRDGKRVGYITGPALYNRLGLTTQIPKTVTVASNRSAQLKDFGTLRVKYLPRRAPITELNVPLLEILDVLKDVNKVPDARSEEVLKTTANQLRELSASKLSRLQSLAVDYYGASTRAVLGLLLESIGKSVLTKLRQSISPLSTYRVGINEEDWPQARTWNVR